MEQVALSFLIEATVGGLPPIFTPGSTPKTGVPLIKATVGGVPPIFTTGSTPKKGITLIKATVPPIFTTGSTPKKGITHIKATVGRYAQFSLPGQRQKRVYLSSRLRQGGTPNFQCRVNAKKSYTSDQCYAWIVPPIFTTGSIRWPRYPLRINQEKK